MRTRATSAAFVALALVPAVEARADMTLAVDLITDQLRADGQCPGADPGQRVGRVTVTDDADAVVAQVVDVPMLLKNCTARFDLAFSPEVLDALLTRDLFLEVETCGRNVSTCTFASAAQHVVGPDPLHTLLDDVYSLLQGQNQAALEAAIAAEQAARIAGDAQLQVDLDAEGIARIAAVQALQAGLDAETAARIAAAAGLQAGLDAESAARAAADVALENGLDAEAAARIAADVALQNGLDAEAAARAAADALLQAEIDAETAARVAAIVALQNGIDAETAARIAADTALQGAIDAEAGARAAADATLQANIDAEAAARLAGETSLGDLIDAEAAARAAADTTLQGNVDAEAAARAAADTTLQNNINAEAAARGAADATLENNINAEAAARGAADTTLQNNINAEAAARGAADTTLQSNIDSEAAARMAADDLLVSSVTAVAPLQSSGGTTPQLSLALCAPGETLVMNGAGTGYECGLAGGALGPAGPPGPQGPVGPQGPPSAIVASVNMQYSIDDRSGWTHQEVLGDDTCFFNIPLGFTFNGFGASVSEISVSSNGVLFFGQNCSSSFTNSALPTFISPNPLLAFFWDDLFDFGSGEYFEYTTQGSAPGRVFNMYYRNRFLSSACGSDPIQLMIQIHETSNLVNVTYSGFSGCLQVRGSSATFGLQTAGGTDSFLVGYNSPIMDDNRNYQSMSFHPPN